MLVTLAVHALLIMDIKNIQFLIITLFIYLFTYLFIFFIYFVFELNPT